MKSILTFCTLLFINVLLLLSSCKHTEPEAKETYVLDNNSVAEWKGSSPALFHEGDFSVSSTNLKVVNAKIKSGTFTIPIASIRNFDLSEEVKPQLLNHLKSPDFFNLALYPEASFTIVQVTPYTGKESTAIIGANYLVNGNFTLLGKTNSISFPAKININNKKLTAEATFTLDRTKWGMNYAADPALGEHHILPAVSIHLLLNGHRS
ncbi:YceI family protein [Adhaeribacter radiodurans]|uniref:YceI family protein n=1 Tax=Adhaeribacter radiodurans TaxID=2745197 RepID=A0A7L7L6A0_9BACT|nr:YceI family protein [Adhaeribacter radiodurans]QMU28338.1 YceI family protein [Adhaeribacter radiodurans]